ncbi:MAG: GNAT family N-acetyltransferase [Treponemataceae bacterium]|nr:GNAT family N-acetyltransferase [Treponemataceae bacterium]
MELIFRKAALCDAKPVFDFVQNAVSVMIRQKIFQWDEIYPTYGDFERDIKNGEAFVVEAAENQHGFEGRRKIAAVYVLNRECDEAYKTGKWQYGGDDYIVLHRFCVNPEFQHKGIGRNICAHILAQAKADGIKAVRLDVFTQNPYSRRLYEKLGFKTIGSADWRKGKFLLQEKIL